MIDTIRTNLKNDGKKQNSTQDLFVSILKQQRLAIDSRRGDILALLDYLQNRRDLLDLGQAALGMGQANYN